MASLNKIRMITKTVVSETLLEDGLIHFEIKEELVEFNPPICDVCNNEMRNINTVEGKRRYQCVTWGCTNRRLYDMEGNKLGG